MDFKLKPEYDDKKNIWNITVQGEIDIYNSPSVKDYLSTLITEHECDIYLNCSELEYIDSTGLGALVAIVKKVRQYDGNIHIIGIKPNVAKVFKITNLDKVFIIEGDDNA